jgi:predicted RNase H-like HicB family nuclease
MLQNYMVKYTEIASGYMGQLVEWPEVITEGQTVAECRENLVDALQEMIAAYRQLGKEIPTSHFLGAFIGREFAETRSGLRARSGAWLAASGLHCDRRREGDGL